MNILKQKDENAHRRTSDNENVVMRFYGQYKEILHIAGFVILAIFTLGGNWATYQAKAAQMDTHELRISKLEYQSGQILQNLEDIKFFLHVPVRH